MMIPTQSQSPNFNATAGRGSVSKKSTLSLYGGFGGGTFDNSTIPGFVPLREEDEPLTDEMLQQLPGNLKKSYLMMEI